MKIDPDAPRDTLVPDLINPEEWKRMKYVKACYDAIYERVKEDQADQLETQIGPRPNWLNSDVPISMPGHVDVDSPNKWLSHRGHTFFDRESGKAWLASPQSRKFLRTH
ncbi:hypothetical protein PG996_008816 [Apiospora saccharicola]|uniref:Uncharacterized protein n=1 Tax=Apiospora saccharicola TaxID=335842 RepID=A0ABR1UYZ9_9PEZI